MEEASPSHKDSRTHSINMEECFLKGNASPVVECKALRDEDAAFFAQVLGRQICVLAIAQLVYHDIQPLHRFLLQLLLLHCLHKQCQPQNLSPPAFRQAFCKYCCTPPRYLSNKLLSTYQLAGLQVACQMQTRQELSYLKQDPHNK